MSDVKITISNTETEIQADGETSLLEVLRKQDIYVRSGCGGNGSCGECVIKIRKEGVDLPPMNAKEQSFLGNVYHITKERLACQCLAKNVATIDLTAHHKAAEENRMRDKNRKLRSK